MLFDRPGAFAIASLSAAREAALSHMLLKISSASPTSFQDIDKGEMFAKESEFSLSSLLTLEADVESRWSTCSSAFDFEVSTLICESGEVSFVDKVCLPSPTF